MQIKQIIKSPIISIAIITTIVLLIYITGKKGGDNYKANILNKPSLTTGIVTDVDLKGRLGNFIEYHFTYNGNTVYSNGNARKEYASLKNFIIYKQFPVIFSSVSPSYNMMLILPEDFKDYNVPFPDSLNWVLQYIK
jgi:hypothetical protein